VANRLIKNLSDYLGLRPHLLDPWKFVRARKSAEADATPEVQFKAGFAVRLADAHVDRQTLNGIFGRDEYRLNGLTGLETVVDIGANIGLFSIRVAPLARRVIAVEPLPDHFKLLQANLSDPRFRHVTTVPHALSGTKGPLELWVSSNPGGHSILRDVAKGANSVRVEATTLRDLFADHSIDRCDLLKLDCEGAEYESLAAAPEDLWPRIDRIHLEFHQGPAGWTGERLAAMLRERGYRCDLVARGHHPDQGHLFASRR
jgi:FkbM family methyltransferase